MHYVIYLKNYAADYVQGDKRQGGYVCANSLTWGELATCREQDGAARFATEEQAEEAIKQFVERFGLDDEEANIRRVNIPSTYDLELGGGHGDDGIGVVEEGGKRFLVVRNFGFEASEEIPEEVAELLVPVLIKIEQRLEQRIGDEVGRTNNSKG
jgi:hypothetical protein